MTITPDNARAVVEWRAITGGPTAAIKRAFSDARYDLIIGAAPSRFARQPDLAIVDLRLASDPEQAMAQLTSSAYSNGAPCGTIVYVNPKQRSVIERRWPRRTLIESTQSPTTMITAIDARVRLGRLGEAATNRLQALAATDGLLSWPSPLTPSHRSRILLAGPPAITALSLMTALRTKNASVSAAFSAAQIMNALDHLNFDAIVIQPRTHDDLLVMLGRSLKRQARRRTLPVFLIEDELDEDRPVRPSETLQYLMVSPSPSRAAQEICRAADLHKRHQTLRVVLNLLDTQRPQLTRDCAKDYFLAQLEQLLKRRVATKAPLGAITIKFPSKLADRVIAQQKSRLANHVLRMIFRQNDIVFQINRDTWIALCPYAPHEALPAMAERARVMGASVLSQGDPHVSRISVEAHEKAPEFIARALRTVRDRPHL